MSSAWQCVESPSRELLGLGVGESQGFPPCVFGVEARWVGVRSLTGLGRPQGRGSTSPAAAQFIVEGKLFSSQICACNPTAALHVGCSDGLGRPVLLPRHPQDDRQESLASSSQPVHCQQIVTLQSSESRRGLLLFKVLSVCSRYSTFQSWRDMTDDLTQSLGVQSGQRDAQGHTAS